ncbi:MAG: sulfatase [Planctomycetota bacterium]
MPILLLLLLAACAPPLEPEAPARQPNVVLVLVDDLGYFDLGCYGNPAVRTPRIDGFSREAVRFTDGYAAAPVCSPTRASIMTGKSPARVRITNHAPDHEGFWPDDPVLEPAPMLDRLPLEEVTLAEHLSAAGYDTAFMGKWHLAPQRVADAREWYPDRQGFDVNVGGNGAGGPGRFFAPYRFPNLESREEGEYLPSRLGEEAVAFLEGQAEGEGPFFLALWHYAVHWPIEAPAELVQEYEARGVQPGVKMPEYAAMTEALDQVFGRVLDALERTGLADDTLVVFTSDNGALLSVADLGPLRKAKGYLYEGGIRVPFMVRWPGVTEAGRVDATPILSTDLFPTILTACGVPLPADYCGDGVDLGPLLAGGALDREAIHFHYPNYAWHRSNRLGGAIRAGRHKLIERFDDGSVELYDLEDDLGEQRDLAPEQPELAEDLRRQLAAWREHVDAAMPTSAR